MGFSRDRRIETIYLGRSFPPEGRRKELLGWRKLWKRIKGRQLNTKKVVNSDAAGYSYSRSYSNGSALIGASYDPAEYSQNFDHGSGSTEHDNLSRSFSARFADPSLIHQTHHLLTD